MKISKRDKVFNGNVFTGLVAGLFVIWSQIASDEIIRILKLPEHYIFQMFIPLIIAIFLFVIFVLTNHVLRK